MEMVRAIEKERVFCTIACKIVIKPPLDTQRTERQGERGI
jgi:hypothetical protein